jgi:hypothetical protein
MRNPFLHLVFVVNGLKNAQQGAQRFPSWADQPDEEEGLESHED